MSAENNPQGSADEGAVSFEELPEVDQSKGNTGALAAAPSASTPEVDAAKGGYKNPPYSCPEGQKWDAKAKKCVPIKKGGEGSETAAPATPVQGAEGGGAVEGAGKDKDYKCPAGEVWDEEKDKCVPIKEALAERDARIKELSDIVANVTSALRLKDIESKVDAQVKAGHLAPVQRDKAIQFMAGLPDTAQEGFMGILSHQKFALDEETGAQTTVPPGTPEKKGIGESESLEGLTDEQKAELRKRFGIDDLIKEKGVKK